MELVEPGKRYSVAEAAELVGKFPKAKFDESVELAFKMTIDPRKTDQMIRGTVRLPHGSGKEVKVLVFAKEVGAVEAAKEAGAEYIGFEEYIEKVTSGWTDFDVAIATPEAMGEVRKLGRVLGPRGLMPNPKTGTVTDDTAKAVQEVKAGRVEYKLDKGARTDCRERSNHHRRDHQGQAVRGQGPLHRELRALLNHEPGDSAGFT